VGSGPTAPSEGCYRMPRPMRKAYDNSADAREANPRGRGEISRSGEHAALRDFKNDGRTDYVYEKKEMHDS
jgi:hypothetical protein